MFFKLWF